MCVEQPDIMPRECLRIRAFEFVPPLPCFPTSDSLFLPALLSPTTVRKQILNYLLDLFMRKTAKAGKCYHLGLKCHTPSEFSIPVVLCNLNAVSFYQGFSHIFFRDVR